jgi:multiple sugar transport system permease protein
VTVLGLLVNSIAAFAFAKLQFRFKKVLFLIFVSSLVIPAEVLLVPNYIVVNSLGWINTFKALIVPSICSVFGIFLLVQFFSDIPREMLDAARIDGAGWAYIYRKIVIPAAVPALITLGLITFLNQWDSYLWPLIVINNDNKQMLQVAISTFSTLEIEHWGRILAADTVATIPVFALFLLLQRHYVASITLSSIKG